MSSNPSAAKLPLSKAHNPQLYKWENCKLLCIRVSANCKFAKSKHCTVLFDHIIKNIVGMLLSFCWTMYHLPTYGFNSCIVLNIFNCVLSYNLSPLKYLLNMYNLSVVDKIASVCLLNFFAEQIELRHFSPNTKAMAL